MVGVGVVLFDQLFSLPKVHQGIIIEKVEVPKKALTPYMVPYGGLKSYRGTVGIRVHDFHQWIAVVRSDDNEILKVHCSTDHYATKEVGDTLLFKEYKGDLLGIDYLVHSEEDTLQTDWNKVFKH